MQAAGVVTGDTNAMPIVSARLEQRAPTVRQLAVLAEHAVSAYKTAVFPARVLVCADELVQRFNLHISVHRVAEFA